eukprot:TRINITY_DN121010_c0_g1_i1.p1 TRINITY_DN121010_c0_g1~~TRINITY_DN121010_c0_g1_i1.p1  ORF type:complete len:788 (+),score=131.69 TRINITY_DN121010_c0_g1_i1:68-2431(+)
MSHGPDFHPGEATRRWSPASSGVLLALCTATLWKTACGQEVTSPAAQPDQAAAANQTGTTYFQCNTSSCAQFDNWFNINPVDDYYSERYRCRDAQQIGVRFGEEAMRQCRVARENQVSWVDCKQRYCETLEEIRDAVVLNGGPGYFGGEECQPFVYFNRTLCETSYRDAEAFCDCLCPSFYHMEGGDKCWREAVNFLVMGRRGLKLAEIHAVTSQCAAYMCDMLELVGDPRKPMESLPFGGVPPKCRELDLPFKPAQCTKLVLKQPYEPCPWEENSGKTSVLRCTTGFECDIDESDASTWSCCGPYGYRSQCPPHVPTMCFDPLACDGSSDHCCAESAAQCRSGKARGCSSVLRVDLPEWRGIVEQGVKLPPGDTRANATEEEESLARIKFTTTEAPGLRINFRRYGPIAITVIGVCMLVCGVGVCYCLGMLNILHVNSVKLGATRVMNMFRAETVQVFRPSGVALSKGRDWMPPEPPDPVEIEARRQDQLACEGLAKAVHDCEAAGTMNLVVNVHSPPPRGEAPLLQAIEAVKARGLQYSMENTKLIARAEKWLRTLEVERKLVQVVHAVSPDLRAAANLRHTHGPGPCFGGWKGGHQPSIAKGVLKSSLDGPLAHLPPETVGSRPWHTTGDGANSEGAVRAQQWANVEALTLTIKEAEEGGASRTLVQDAKKLWAGIVARTPALPADRCVLDPDGEGLKVLPPGQLRAVWSVTGDAYNYMIDGEVGGIDVPPREELGDVAVDESRPVCSIFVEKGKCHLGRKCPWRHCQPMPGDSIREPVKLEDV